MLDIARNVVFDKNSHKYKIKGLYHTYETRNEAEQAYAAMLQERRKEKERLWVEKERAREEIRAQFRREREEEKRKNRLQLEGSREEYRKNHGLKEPTCTRNLQAAVTQDMYIQVMRIANQLGTSLSAFVRVSIEEAMQRYYQETIRRSLEDGTEENAGGDN